MILHSVNSRGGYRSGPRRLAAKPLRKVGRGPDPDRQKHDSLPVTPAGFYGGRFAERLSHGTDAISAAGTTALSLADFSIYNCPATNIAAANAIANIAPANWGTS